MPVRPAALPDRALLQAFAAAGDYADCFATDLPQAVTHARYVEAFYTTWLFKLERWILKWAISRPSTDDEARQLAAGTVDRFNFGSAVVRKRGGGMGGSFGLLLGFHKLYSRLLLGAARRRLERAS